MRPRAWAPVLVLVGSLLGPAASSQPQAPLRFNPFAAPDLVRPQAGAPGGDLEEPWQPVLRATLRADDGSLADLGGVLLGEGESHRGWRLLAVGEFEAVFERQGERVTLPVAPRSSGVPGR